MKVTLERNHLLKSLGHVHRVVERRNTYPVLANVLLRADENGLELRTTDLDIEVRETVPADVTGNGATTVPAHTLYEIVRKLADGAEVHLETGDDQIMAITSSRSKFFLSCLSADGFPDLKSGDFTHRFTVAASELAGLIERTQFAISNEETRYYLNGIYFHHIEEEGKNLLRAAATDGHRLARTDIEAPDGVAGMAGIIVPRKTVTEMAKLLDGVEDEVFVELSDSKIRLKVARVVLLSKLIEGTFPDYERVMPKDNDKRMAVDRVSFAAAVDRVSTIASERGGKVVKLSLSEGMLELSVTNPDHGNASEELPVDYGDPDFEIGFNARYLLDIISQIKSDNAIFLFGDQGSPTLVSDENQANAVYVLMPMRV